MAQRNRNGPQSPTDDWLFLMGRQPMEDALSFVKSVSIGDKFDPKAFVKEWRAANSHYKKLERTEQGLADDPPIIELPRDLEPLRKKLLADPIYRRSYSGIQHRIALVEMDRLVVFQRYMDLTFTNKMKAALGDEPTDEDVFRFAMPIDHPKPEVRIDKDGRSFDFLSPSTDLRFIDAKIFQEEHLTGYEPPGSIGAVLGLVVGFGSNFLYALHYKDRLVLNNGSHRAYSLRDHGIKMAPCIVHEVKSLKELKNEASGDLSRHPEVYLNDPRPPLLKDYFDLALLKVIKAKHNMRRVRIRYDVEVTNPRDS